MHRIVMLVVVFVLAAASPAAAMHMETGYPSPGAKAVFVAYGTGATVCDITVAKTTGRLTFPTSRYGTAISGKTKCTAPVAQTGRATVPASGWVSSLDGGLCSGTRTDCSSGGTWWNVQNWAPMTYRITLRAPFGQGWVGAPTNCSGIGSDNLSCDFSLNDLSAHIAA